METQKLFVGWPAERRNVIPPSLIGEYRSCTCAWCGAELVCHEPSRKREWGGAEIVCQACAADTVVNHDGPQTVNVVRDEAMKRHWRRG